TCSEDGSSCCGKSLQAIHPHLVACSYLPCQATLRQLDCLLRSRQLTPLPGLHRLIRITDKPSERYRTTQMARKAEGNSTTPSSTGVTRSAAQLKQLRSQIDKLDVEIVKLVNQRAAIAAEIGRAKLEQGEDIFSPAREEEVYQNVLQTN